MIMVVVLIMIIVVAIANIANIVVTIANIANSIGHDDCGDHGDCFSHDHCHDCCGVGQDHHVENEDDIGDDCICVSMSCHVIQLTK